MADYADEKGEGRNFTGEELARGFAIPWEYRGPCQCGEGIGGHGASTGTCPNGKTRYRPREAGWKPGAAAGMGAVPRAGSGLTITEAEAESDRSQPSPLSASAMPTQDSPHMTLLTETRLTWKDVCRMAWVSGLAIGLGGLALWGVVEACEWVGRQF